MKGGFQERKRGLVSLLIAGFGCIAAFLILAFYGYPAPALVTGLAGMVILAVYTVIYIDVTTRANQ